MAIAEQPMADLVGRTLGEFTLREQIGEGGCAVVYRSEQPALKRNVVVKVLHERGRYHDAARERFLREARLASLLDHPYAAHVYAFGTIEDEGLLWIAMELVQGITLGDRLEAHGPMPLQQFVPFFERVAEVVQDAHERGIVHRDLKPSNVMVIERRGGLFPKLLDFGIAKVSDEVAAPTLEPANAPCADGVVTAPLRATPRRAQRTRTDPEVHDPRLTRSSSKIGSAAYMSPEQWTDARAVGPATDIYSLGILAYEALTGRRPFTGQNTNEYYHQHVYAEIPQLGGDFSPDLSRVIQRALAKDPGARHGNVLEFASELRATLRAQPREQLRSLAQVWDDRARSPALLLKSDDLMRAPTGVIGELERAFVVASQRHAARSVRIRRLLAASAAALVLGAVWYRGELKTELAEQRTVLAEQRSRTSQQVTEATVTQAELEQGRSALLHNEPEALPHLAEAYRRDRSPSTAFMLARAMQPRLAEQARFPSSFGQMWSATFSPDGHQLVTTDDKNAQVWDAETYRLLFTLPHGNTVYQATYSNDGTKLVTAGGDGAVRIWDAARGTLIHELRRDGTKLRYYMVALSPDGKLVAAIDTRGAVAHVWGLATAAPIVELRNEALEFPGLVFSSDGHWLATTSGNDVRVFDTQTWKPAITVRGSGIHSLAFDPTGPRLVTGATTGDVSIWAIPSGTRIRHLRELGEPVSAVAFSPDGQLVVTASGDGSEQVWHTGSGELQSQFSPRHSKILAVEFDRTSQLVVAAGADGAVVVADAALGMPVTVLEGPQSVLVAHFDPSSRHVVSASLDGTARVWDATSLYRRWSSPPVSDDCGIVTSAEPDSRFIAVGCRDHATRVWDTARGQMLAELPSVSHVEGDFTSAFPAVSREGDRAAIARGNAVEVYELPGGRLLRTIAHGAPVNAVAFASTGGDIISGAIDGSLLVARASGALLALPTSPGGIDAVGVLPDGRIVAVDARRHLRVYDPGGAVQADVEIPGRVMSLRIEGARLVTVPIVPIYSGNAAAPLLLDLKSYRVIAQLEGHVGRVFSARWVTGNQILTAGGDGTAKLWDGSTGELRRTYQGGSRFFGDATLVSDALVIAGGADGLLRFWDAVSGRLLWALPAHKSQLIGLHVERGEIVTRGFTGELSRWALPNADQVVAACSDHESCAIVRR